MDIKSNALHILETYGASYQRTYLVNSNNVHINDNSIQWQSLKTFFIAIFLPHGYPDSVSDDYLQYQLWDSIQAFASSITGGICTHAILKGVGVGNENASALAATITWLLKDGSSMMGRIGFVWLKGTKLDSDCKKWRLFADIMNDTALFLDLVSGYFQEYFLFIACTSGLLKAIVGVSGSCTRTALTQHQARKNNIADVSAKDGSQETLVNLLALVCCLFFIPIVSESHILTWFVFVLMTSVHLAANYLAVKSVKMETFNEARFKIFANHYFKEGIETRKFLSVEEVNKKESVFFNYHSSTISIKLGASFLDIIERKRYEEIQKLLALYKNSDYILSVSKKNSKGTISIVFNKKATTYTQMEALFQACYILQYLQNKSIEDIGNESIIEDVSREFTVKRFKDFINCLQAKHFNTNIVVFDIDNWRADW